MVTPNVLTTIIEKNSNFTLKAYAYRTLTVAEQRQALLQWLHASKEKDFPKNGKGEVITSFGQNPSDVLY
jgi:hypothetical protein